MQCINIKLLERRNRIVDNIEYRRWSIGIPAKYIEEIGWKKGQRLRTKVTYNTLVFGLDDQYALNPS